MVSEESNLNYQLLVELSYFAMFFVCFSCLQDIFGETEVQRQNKWSFWIKIAQFIPEWLIVICEGSLMVYLIIALRKQYMLIRRDKPIPFIALIVLLIGEYIITLIATFIDESAEEGLYLLFSLEYLF